MSKARRNATRLIVAASDQDADMLYATRFWAGDPFIFLQRNGKRTIVLTDLEMDRGRRTARVNEFVSFNQLEREVQGKSKEAPPFEKVLAHFLRKRRVKRATVPMNFPLGYARELARSRVAVTTTNGLFWPEREAKTDEELKLIGRALRITEVAMARAMDVLRRSTVARDKKLRWSGKALTSEILRAEIDTAILRAGGTPANTIAAGGDQACDPHERGSGPLRANELIILDIFPRDPSSGYWGDLTRT
ncbi:MAG TPA: M24 family metallopeptidase, partial [Chthoniobacterales bacterium]|nr:M24 family metallopeptidase [Chthoniobacterales bacterium]